MKCEIPKSLTEVVLLKQVVKKPVWKIKQNNKNNRRNAPEMTNTRRDFSLSRYHHRYKAFLLIPFLILILFNAQEATGGICWSSISNGKCKELLSQGVTQQECCASSTAAATAYSDEDLDSGSLFFWRVLGGGVQCKPCRESCAEVECEEGKKCVLRRGRPRCVCSPECKSPRGSSNGPVCGTDGRSYRSLCRLKKHACKKASHELAVAYTGYCQSSCTRVHCEQGRSCLLDQNLSPHCVKCARKCPQAPQQVASARPVCGADGNTYKSACHLRLAACRAGRAIPVAYKGHCKLSHRIFLCANVDQTCQAWSHALTSPSLWKSIRIIIDRDLRNDFPSTRNIVAKYGQYIKRLELTWSLPYTLPREARVSLNIRVNEGIDFLEVIKNKNVQLEKLILTDWFFGTNWNHRSKLVNALARFLRTQHKLKLLSLLNANLGVADVLKACRAISWSCGNVLEYLDIRGAFRDWQAPYSNSRYIRYLSRLHVLTAFQLDYPALSDEVLNSLASAASNVLKNLHISIRDSDSRQHIVGDAAWNNLVVACPQLTVSYTIVNISHYEDVSYLLLPSIPLTRFYMYGGHVWDQSRSRNFRSTVGLLITYYPNTLVEVMLQVRNNRELLDDLLIFMIQRCKRLTKLQYDGIIRNLETLRYIFQLQAEKKTQFKTIHITPKNVSTQNRVILDDINYQYHCKMLDQVGVTITIDGHYLEDAQTVQVVKN